jgi:signal transduction histidine kinase
MIRKSIRMARQPNWASARVVDPPGHARKGGWDRHHRRQARHGRTLIAVELRPPSLHDFGLIPALEASPNPRPPTTCGSSSSPWSRTVLAFHRRQKTATYRIVQEAITNAVKHANARTISVSLIEHEDHLVSLIEDDGDGFHTSQVSNGRLGLKGMYEPANILDGTITVQSTPNHGTAVRAPIPVNPPGQEGARA